MSLPLRLATVILLAFSVLEAPALRAQTAYTGPLYVATLQPLPGANASRASGTATLQLSADGSSANVDVLFSNLTSEEVTAHLKVGGVGNQGTFVFGLGPGQVTNKAWSFTPTGTYTSSSLESALASGGLYVEIDTTSYPSGELGGQFLLGTGSQVFTAPAPAPEVDLSTVYPADGGRFLTQATFGPAASDMNFLIARGYVVWIAIQMELPETSHLAATRADAAAFPPPPTSTFSILQSDREAAWWKIAVTAPDQLRQRVAFALSELFVVSDQASSLANRPEALASYYDMLANDAFGNFRQLLEDVTLSPVMGNYLNMLRNYPANAAKGTAADENYAREVMQLFTIGLDELWPDGTLKLDSSGQPIPTYDQTTIVQTANLLTGWAYHSTAAKPSFTGSAADWYDPMMLYPAFHDNSQKTIVGGVVVPANEGGAADLRLFLDTLFNHPNTAPFVSRRLIQRLVTSNPSPGYVYRVAQVFADDGAGTRGNLAAVVKAILLDPEARSPAYLANAGYGKLKEPLLRETALLRAFGGAAADGRYAIFNTDNSLSQTPLGSATVFNFFLPDFVEPGSLASAGLYAPEFQITTASTALSVPNYLYQSIYTSSTPAATTVVLDLSSLASEVSQNASTALETLDLFFCGGGMTDATRQEILSAAARLPKGTSALTTAQLMLDLAVTSPDAAVQL